MDPELLNEDGPLSAIFIGIGSSAQCWYRCALPAIHLKQDWVGIAGQPPNVRYMTGVVRGETQRPNLTEYETLVVQSPRGANWRKAIRALQGNGRRVIFEIDDYIQAIAKMPDHDYKRFFGREDVKDLELNMRCCDGIIVATDFLAQKYRRFNRNVWVCRNGLDLLRYRLSRPWREHPTIIWAGGTGHAVAMKRWLPAVIDVMRERPKVKFVTIGEPFADVLGDMFPGRTLSLPFLAVENYPAAMTLGDIAIAPAGRNLYAQGKSDLRFLEAGALGIACVADPLVYGRSIEDGVTGLLAAEPEEIYEHLLSLVDDRERRERIGLAARHYVWSNRDVSCVAGDWLEPLQLPAAIVN